MTLLLLIVIVVFLFTKLKRGDVRKGNGLIGGVFYGISQEIGVNAWVLRFLFFLFGLFDWFNVIVYILVWIMTKKENVNDKSIEDQDYEEVK